MNTNTNTASNKYNARTHTVGGFTNVYGPRGSGKTYRLDKLSRAAGVAYIWTTGDLLTEYVELAKRELLRTRLIFVDEATSSNRKALAELVAAGFTVVAASRAPLRLAA